MSLLQFFAGSGRRRKSDENWADLQRQLSDAQARAKKVKGAHFHECPQRVHPPFWVYAQGVACPWCLVDQLRGQLELVTMRPAPRPDAVAVAAPADQNTAAIGRPADEPAADVTAETQPVDVRDLRAAMGEDDTDTLPAVVPVVPVVAALDDTQMLVTWGTKIPAKTKADLADWATGTAPGPMHEVPVGLGAKASVNVTAALEEAS